MPVRMWKHEVYSSFKLLPHRVLDVLRIILVSISLGYLTVGFLYGPVSPFDTWIEVLVDLGRYGVAINNDAIRDREAKNSVRSRWYIKAPRIASMINCLYHHLAILAKPMTYLKLYSYIRSLCVPTLSWEPHHSWSTGLFELNSHSDMPYNVNSGKAKTPKSSVYPTFPQTLSPCELLSNSQDVYQLPLDLGSPWGSKGLIRGPLRQKKRSLKNFIFCFAFSLADFAFAFIAPSHQDFALESRQLGAPNNVRDNDDLAWLWYPPIVVGILVGEFVAVYILGDPLLLHGVSMGISAGAYLVMVFNQHKIPFHVQISTWVMCAILTIVWTYYDMLKLCPETRRLAVLAVIVIGFLLDSGISSVFASTGDSVFVSNDSPSTAFIFATFLLPCMTMSAFLCSGLQGLYRQTTQHWAWTNTAYAQTGQKLGV
ncbi:hypothetical protein F4680DRAFT_411281 [Xylaria scruposa]|nr:hypothetical protein F4680DRAFT_411281 [Xylaria scruposa]